METAGNDQSTKYAVWVNPTSERTPTTSGQVLIDSGNNSKLQMNYIDMIQNDKVNEITLKNVLCNAKDILLGNLTLFHQSESTHSLEGN